MQKIGQRIKKKNKGLQIYPCTNEMLYSIELGITVSYMTW